MRVRPAEIIRADVSLVPAIIVGGLSFLHTGYIHARQRHRILGGKELIIHFARRKYTRTRVRD